MSSPLEVALQYLHRGWSVMAVPQRTKERRRQWAHLQRSRPTAEEVRRDFAAEPGIPNLAIVCGIVSGGLAALDADGSEAVQRVEALGLRPTLRVRTARGLHVYFRAAGRVQSRRLSLRNGAGLELRGEGAYVLAPPSQHPSGVPYRWEDPDAPLAPLPATVLDLFGESSTPVSAAPPVPERWRSMVARWPKARQVWEGRAGDHPDQSGSGKDMSLAWFARKQGYSREEVGAILCAAPYEVQGGRSPDYLKRTLDKVFAGKGTRPRVVAPFGRFPAWVVTSGAWARLSRRAKAAYGVLVVFAERPSFIVRVTMERLAVAAAVSVDRIGKATDELARAGLIRKQPAAGWLWNLWVCLEPGVTCSAPSAEHVSADKRVEGLDSASSRAHSDESAEHVSPDRSAPSAEHVLLDHEWTSGAVRDPGAPGSPEGGGEGDAPASAPAPTALAERGKELEEAAGRAVALPSMPLVDQTTPDGTKVVSRRLRDGTLIPVFRGTLSDWLAWRPPEVLRDESRMAEWPTPKVRALFAGVGLRGIS